MRHDANQLIKRLSLGASCLIGSVWLVAGEEQPAGARAGDFFYAIEERGRAGGRESARETYYLGADGVAQRAYLAGDAVTRLKECRIASVGALFSTLGMVHGSANASEKSGGTDEYRPPQFRLYAREGGDLRLLYGGPSDRGPPEIGRLLSAYKKELENTAGSTEIAPCYLQAIVIEPATVEVMRRDHLLRTVNEAALADATLSATALRNPFRLVPCALEQLRADSIAQALSWNAPVIDLQFGQLFLQLRLIAAHRT